MTESPINCHCAAFHISYEAILHQYTNNINLHLFYLPHFSNLNPQDHRSHQKYFPLNCMYCGCFSSADTILVRPA